MRIKIGIALIASCLALSGIATELSAAREAPEMAGSLDGEQLEWFVLSHGNDSNASFVEMGDDVHIDITGSVDDEVWEGEEALSISLSVNARQLNKAVVIYSIGNSITPPIYTSEGGDVVVTLTHYERISQTLHVAGKIEGVLGLQVGLDAPASLERGIEINVAFDVEAQKIEF